MKETIGWIGTGVMGRSMCSHLIDAGYSVSVYTRTKSKALALLEKGARWCDSPGEAAIGSAVVFTIVGYPDDVEELYLGNNGLLSAAAGTVLVDMTTSRPELARRIAEGGAKNKLETLDAPVSGGDTGARNGTLAIMVGGQQKTYDRVMPFFKIMGENIALMGPAGSGQHTKMSNQILIASTMTGTVESLLYAYRAGLDPDRVIDIIGKGAASSWSINNLGRRMVKGDFDPGFFIKHFVKDMRIALMEADRMNLSLPGLALAKQFYMAAMAMGFENLGTQALFKVLDRMNQSEL